MKVSGCSFKSQIPCSLKGKHTEIAFLQKSERIPRHLQLHAVTAPDLKGQAVGVGMVDMSVCVVVMVRHSSFCHDPRVHGQPRGIVVIDPFADVSDENEDEQSEK